MSESMKNVVFCVLFVHLTVFPRCFEANSIYCPDEGVRANPALNNLLTDGKAIDMMLIFGLGCRSDMISRPESTNGPNVKVSSSNVCYTVGEAPMVWVLSKTSEPNPAKEMQQETAKDCANKPNYQTYLLPQEDNKNTYMDLNSDTAKLFFTTRLSGCDIFIAKHPSHANKPRVIHSNKNDIPVETREGENIEQKGKDIDDLLNGSGYKVTVRIHAKPSKKDGQTAIGKYKKNHKGITMVEYDTTKLGQPYNFIGHFNDGGWNFFVKGDRDGKIIWKNCENPGDSFCVIM